MHEGCNLQREQYIEDQQSKLVAYVFTQALFDRYDLPTDSLDSLVDIVMSCVDHDSSAAELESLANQHISDIVSLNEYSNTKYNKYMEFAWGKGFTVPLEQSIDDYLMVLDEFGEFHLQTCAHFIFYNQDIWHNDDFDRVMEEERKTIDGLLQ